MDIFVQSFLNSATKLTISVTTSTTFNQLKELVWATEGTTSTIQEFYYENELVDTSSTVGLYNLTTGSYIMSSNNISDPSLWTKPERQQLKLELAQLRRQAGGDTSATYYRVYNIYDLNLLADKYTSNTTTVETTSTLTVHRPWNEILWTPDQLSTALWLDAADASTITLNGSNVSQWSDKSGNGRHVVQGSATLQPVYVTTATNGKPAVRFDGSNDIFNAVSPSNWWLSAIGAGEFSLFHLFRSSNPGFGISVNGLNGGGGIPRLYMLASGLSYNTLSTRPNNSPNYTINSVAFIQFSHDGVETPSVRMNAGTELTATQAAIAPTLGNFSFPFVISGAPTAGDSSEIVVVAGNLSSLDRQKMEGYLAWKWGIVANLPSDHPYKTFPPSQ